MIMSLSLKKKKKKSDIKPDKKEPLKKPTKIDANKFNELINKIRNRHRHLIFSKTLQFSKTR